MSSIPIDTAPTATTFPCRQCGADLAFDPSVGSPRCPWCGAAVAVPDDSTPIEELDLPSWLDRTHLEDASEERLVVRCNACGASATFDTNVTASACPFCGSPQVATGQSRRLIRPRSILPFRVTRGEATAAFGVWIRRLWFAPNALKRMAQRLGALTGVYVPAWTFDCNTTSRYTGLRGDEYTETQLDAATKGGRAPARRSGDVRVRWSPVAGSVTRRFDDLLVLATSSLPAGYGEALEPWDLQHLVPFNDEYLAGFRAECYSIPLPQGWQRGCAAMDRVIRRDVAADIGGDRQQIHSIATRREAATFKHVLLPVWMSGYRYGDRVYRFLVNGRTGEIQGERPWSWVKITLAVAAALLVIAVVALVSARA